ncbi:MAG: DUF2971 domain-containing protein [Bifidobacterium choerinum]
MPLTYHYCSLDTACAIVQNGSLRLCDVTKSNDSAEITYGYAAATDGLRRAGLVSGSGDGLRFVDDWDALLRPDYRALLREALSDHMLPPNRLCYAACLSEEADLLSQWRAYGDDGRGAALGFDLSDFAQANPSFTVRDGGDRLLETHMMTMYRPIVYGHDRAAAYFDVLASRIARDVHDLRSTGECDDARIRARLLDATLEFVASTAFCKKRFFHEEREWRLAVWGPNANVDGFEGLQAALAAALPRRFPDAVTHARFLMLARGDRLVPTLDLGLDLRRTLRRVVIGPRCAASARDIRMLLAGAHVADASIARSLGTYR